MCMCVSVDVGSLDMLRYIIEISIKRTEGVLDSVHGSVTAKTRIERPIRAIEGEKEIVMG